MRGRAKVSGRCQACLGGDARSTDGRAQARQVPPVFRMARAVSRFSHRD